MSLSWNEVRDRAKPFASDRERVEHLFALYEQLTAPLALTETTTKPKRKQKLKT